MWRMTWVLEQDAVAAEQVAGVGDDLAGFAGVVELGQAGDRVGEAAGLLQAGELHAGELHAGDLGEQLHEPVLDDLNRAQRLPNCRRCWPYVRAASYAVTACPSAPQAQVAPTAPRRTARAPGSSQ
jgi:hypothetical protein